MYSFFIKYRLPKTALLLLLCFYQTIVYAEQKLYVINIASSQGVFSARDLPKVNIKQQHRFYSIKLKTKNAIWNRLRLGFFTSKDEAQTYLKSVSTQYPDAFLGLVPAGEVEYSKTTEIHSPAYPALYLLLRSTDALIASAASLKPPVDKTDSADTQTAQQAVVDNYYIINLKTASNLNDFDSIIRQQEIQKHALYISELEIDRRTWYQYRLGFFIDKKSAEITLNNLQKTYPLARIIRISPAEKQLATDRIRAFSKISTPLTTPPAKTQHASNARELYPQLINRGTRALSEKDYKSAIDAFTQLLSYPENSYSMDAHELLGFAYELNNQIAYARKTYEEYLSLYPESRGATRVTQRLASLITARSSSPGDLREAKAKTIIPKWETFGSISQFYRRDTSSLDIDTETATSIINTTDSRVNLSEIDTLANFNARYRSNDYELRSRFTGGYIYDFQNDSEGNEVPINELYIDALSIEHNASIRLGRQRSNKGGVFGRFDGIDTGYQMAEQLKMNLTTGYLVPKTTQSANKDEFFTSLRADLGTFFNAWDFSLYYMKQTNGEITGREAIGSEFRYFHPQRSLFGLVDHDILFDKTNTILLNGSWTTNSKTSFNATIDLRQSPLLTTQSALQGQTFTSVDDMLNSFSEDEIIQIAQDRTARVKTFIFGVSQPLSENYTLNADITSSKISATDASAGVEAFPETDTEYFFSSQLIGSHVFRQNDSSIFGINYNDTTTSNTTSLRWNYRIPISQMLRLNPRISIAERDNSDDTTQSILGLAFKMDYRWNRRTSLEFEFSSESSDKTLVTGQEKNDIYYFSLGYHYTF